MKPLAPAHVISKQKCGTRTSLIIGVFVNKRRTNYSHRRDCSFSVVINSEFIFSLQKNGESWWAFVLEKKRAGLHSQIVSNPCARLGKAQESGDLGQPELLGRNIPELFSHFDKKDTT